MPNEKNEEKAILEEDGEAVEEDGVVLVKKKRKKRGTFDGYDTTSSGGCRIRRRRHDPMEVLGWEIMTLIMSKLDARSVALSLFVSRSWLAVASADALWSPKCKELWKGKARILRVSQMHELSRLAAYSLCVMDGKRGAPEYWLNLDPYWKGTDPPMRRYLDGSQTADSSDLVLGGVMSPAT